MCSAQRGAWLRANKRGVLTRLFLRPLKQESWVGGSLVAGTF